MTDFDIRPATFSDTTFTVFCETPAARARFGGGVSFTVAKSALPALVARLTEEGFSV